MIRNSQYNKYFVITNLTFFFFSHKTLIKTLCIMNSWHIKHLFYISSSFLLLIKKYIYIELKLNWIDCDPTLSSKIMKWNSFIVMVQCGLKHENIKALLSRNFESDYINFYKKVLEIDLSWQCNTITFTGLITISCDNECMEKYLKNGYRNKYTYSNLRVLK